MYSIGDLSQLGGVTPRMLRHYHDLGVLVPAEVDDATGYRRYDATQLADLVQVLALKGLGLENQMNNDPTAGVTVATKRLPAVHVAVASGVSPRLDARTRLSYDRILARALP